MNIKFIRATIFMLAGFFVNSSAIAAEATVQRNLTGTWYNNYPLEIMLTVISGKVIGGKLLLYGSSWCEDETSFPIGSKLLKEGTMTASKLKIVVTVDGCDDITIELTKKGGQWRGRLSSIVDNKSYRVSVTE